MRDYSPRTANEQASRLLAKDSIQQELDTWRERIEEEGLVTVEAIINELCRIAFSDIKDYVTIDKDTGAIQTKGFENMPGGSRWAIESISEDRTARENQDGSKILVHKLRLKLYNKLQALQMLCKIKGLLKDRDPREDEIPDYLQITFNRVDINADGQQKT